MNSIAIGMLAATVAATNATQVFRVEMGADEIPRLVGADGVRRAVCIVDPDEYALMTGQVAAVWKSLHSTDDGRRKIHGKRVGQSIDEKAGVKSTVYADGYTFQEPLVRNTREVRRAFSSVPPSKRTPVAAGVPMANISERQKEMRRRREERRNAKPKTVTIEHDAATGKDVVK